MLNIQRNISLAKYTTLKVGGAARFFCEAKSEKEILEAVKFAEEKNLPVFVLGGGSNILVNDQGFSGLVIKILNTKHEIRNTIVECGAGASLSKIVQESIKAGLTGLEWAAGIPGTVGGAVRGNAGAFGGCMAEVVHSVKVIEIPNFSKARLFPSAKQVGGIPQSQALKSQLPITNYQLRECEFAYRESVFKQNPNLIILSVTLKLKKGDRKKSEELLKEILEERKKSQSIYPSPGSFFKNPIVKDEKLIKEFEIDTGQKIKDKKIPAGYFIDRAGLKGKKIGSAMVGEEHANFIVNTGNATAENVVILAAIVKTRVRNKFGIQLKEEVQMVGFEKKVL